RPRHEGRCPAAAVDGRVGPGDRYRRRSRFGHRRAASRLARGGGLMTVTLWLLLAALLANGMLAGASLDQSIKQLPARRRIGVVAYSEYSKAGDLGPGVAWLAALGIGAAVLAVVAALVGRLARPDPPAARPRG